MKSIAVNDLPQYSRWISALLSDSQIKRVKEPPQIMREFGLEKWGGLLAKWQAEPCGIETVREWEVSSETAGIFGGQLMLMSATESFDCQVNWVEQALLEEPSSHLLEIGCGYGSVLFELLSRGRMNYQSVFGLEYTQQGVELAQRLARWHHLDVTIGQGDFNVPKLSSIAIPAQCDVLTSFSISYVRDIPGALANIIKLKPRRVLHFEPIVEHCDEKTVLGLLQRKYLEVNDYNQSLRSSLVRMEEAGSIEIMREESQIWGGNCLAPLSLMVWRPIDTAKNNGV
ncbi:MAG: class I SAM-dependent methyltransferase [Gallionella sp.]|jgi:SAM-dependent methyltransferase